MRCGIKVQWLEMRCGIRHSSVVRDEVWHQTELSDEGMRCGIKVQWLEMRCGIRQSSVVIDEVWHQTELCG